MQPMIRQLLSAALVVAVVLPPSMVRASPFAVPTIDSAPEAGGADEEDAKVAEAKAEYRAGSDAYALGNYEDAIGHFEAAYELSGAVDLLFNLGQSYTRWYDISNDIDHLKKARRLYENYVLNVDSTGLDEQGVADARADAQRRIAEVDRLIAKHDANARDTGDEDKPKKPVYKKAWFWVVIVGGAAAISGGIAAAVVLSGKPEPGFEPELGTIGNASQGGGLTLRF